jgi:hypothetical protein
MDGLLFMLVPLVRIDEAKTDKSPGNGVVRAKALLHPKKMHPTVRCAPLSGQCGVLPRFAALADCDFLCACANRRNRLTKPEAYDVADWR